MPKGPELRKKDKQAKEYLTARVRKGLTQELRDMTPEGFQFGKVVEVAIEQWMELPEPIRIQTLIGGERVSLPELVERVVESKLQAGAAAGKHLEEHRRQKPGPKGSGGPGNEDTPR